MLLAAVFCSNLYCQLASTFPAKIFAGVSIQLFLLSDASARGLFWQVLARGAFLPSVPCGWKGKGSINLLQIALQTKRELVTIPIWSLHGLLKPLMPPGVTGIRPDRYLSCPFLLQTRQSSFCECRALPANNYPCCGAFWIPASAPVVMKIRLRKLLVCSIDFPVSL